MRNSLHTQRGAALIVALIVLVMVTLMAITATRFTLLGTRTTFNHQLKNTAFQAAEVGLARGVALIRSGLADIQLDAQNTGTPSLVETAVLGERDESLGEQDAMFKTNLSYRITRYEGSPDTASQLGGQLPRLYRYKIESTAEVQGQNVYSRLEQGYFVRQYDY